VATKPKKRAKKIVWFAKGGGIAKCGPFASQLEAFDVMRLTKYARGFSSFPFPPDIVVWPEEASR
jgi:hypothetical protein